MNQCKCNLTLEVLSPPNNDSVKPLLLPRPTIKDVARAANVSYSTVSYILNDSRAAARISQQTKDRVWAAVEQLGYQFNPIGRALQRGYTNQVTLLIVSWNLATSHAATAMAISRAAARHDFALTVHVADDDSAAEEFVKRNMLHNLGGVLVLWDSPALEASSLRQLAADGVPVIDLLPGSPDGISVVTEDREDAGFRATQHLIELGHRHIGIIGDLATRPKTTLRKLSGFQRALENAKIPYEEKYFQNVTEFGFEGGQHGFRDLIKRSPQITGLFCINDAIALGAIDAAKDLGKNCPADLSVVGYGDSPEGSHWRPKLTTVALSADRVSTTALTLVLEQRKNPKLEQRTTLIPGDLILRESTTKLGAPVQTNLEKKAGTSSVFATG
jgi:DNA-binding LacI/PurR family transcriptional regulator